MTLDRDLRSRATLGLLTRAALIEAGVTASAIRHRVARGRLHRVHRGVYALDAPPLRPGARELAAVLACGSGAVLSHRSAAILWNLLPDRPGPVHVTTARHRTGPPGVVTHRADPPATRHRQVPLTTVPRTLLDLAATVPHELERALNEARVLELVTEASLDEQLRSGHARGVAALRAAATTGPTLHRSEAERRLLTLIAHARLPRPETNTRVAGYEVDVLFRDQRLVAEVDGYAYHSTPRAFERDRRKDADLQAAGYRVLRFTWRQVTREPHATVATLARAL